MCDPVSLSIAASAVAATASLAGGVVGAEAAQKNAAIQSQIAQNNAMVAQEDARMAMKMGEAQAQNAELATAQRVGRAKAAFGASGVDPDAGSAVNVEAGTEMAGITDVGTTISNASRAAWGYETQSVNFENQANYDIQAGNNQALGSLIGGVGSAAGSLGQAFSGFNTPSSQIGSPSALTMNNYGFAVGPV